MKDQWEAMGEKNERLLGQKLNFSTFIPRGHDDQVLKGHKNKRALCYKCIPHQSWNDCPLLKAGR